VTNRAVAPDQADGLLWPLPFRHEMDHLTRCSLRDRVTDELSLNEELPGSMLPFATLSISFR